MQDIIVINLSQMHSNEEIEPVFGVRGQHEQNEIDIPPGICAYQIQNVLGGESVPLPFDLVDCFPG
ncbi:MAG TPA: hypothetical protein VF704_10180 [Allosphingosinicella sp.]